MNISHMWLWLVVTGVILILISYDAKPQNKAWHATDEYPAFDRWGFFMPVECRRDLTGEPVLIVMNARLGSERPGTKQLGRWMPPQPPSGMSTVYVDEVVIDPQIQDEVLHHERCHARMFRLYGNGRWHE